MVMIGEEIPDLEAEIYQDFEIKKVKLSDYRGKWLILAFYPRDFTFVCPTELEDLADHYEEFRKTYGKCKGDSGYNPKADYDEDDCISFLDFRIWYFEYYLD